MSILIVVIASITVILILVERGRRMTRYGP